MIYRLQHQPDALNRLLFSLSETNIRSRPLKDKWSIFENLAHLGRYQENFISRIQQMLQSKNLVFSRYVAEEDEGFARWCNKTFNQVDQDFRIKRAEINEELQSLSDDQLRQTGDHPVYGTMTIEGWTEFFLLHEAHHFFTIFKLAAQLRPKEEAFGLNKPRE